MEHIISGADVMFTARFIVIFLFVALIGIPSANATPTENGASGLIFVPSADTLDAGNICLGLWGEITKPDALNNQLSYIMPVSMTLGVGSFWEIYGFYPNVLANGDQDPAGRGYATIGTKLRFWGKRGEPFRMAADAFLNRTVSDNARRNGHTEVGGRLIASLRTDQLGMHLYGGYVDAGTPPSADLDDKVIYGFGLEFLPTQRMKITTEVVGNTRRGPASETSIEGSIGYQYYLSPYLTLNLAVSNGITASAQDWRLLLGFSTCQGVGSYIRPVPVLTKGETEGKKPAEAVKPVKIIPLSPLLAKTPLPSEPVSKIEVPVEPDKEEIIIKPYGQVTLTPQSTISPVVIPPPPTPAPNGNLDELPPKSDSGVESNLEGATPDYRVDVAKEQPSAVQTATVEAAEKLAIYKMFRFPDGTPQPGQVELAPDVVKNLAEIAETLRKDNRWSYLRIEAYTDKIGSLKYNMDLSLKRAIVAADYFITREGIDPVRILVRGMGETKPIADNSTQEGRAKNRRFEILVLGQPEKR